MANTADTVGTDLRKRVAELTELVWNQGDLGFADACLSPDFVGHYPGVPDLCGPAAYQKMAAELRRALPDLAIRTRALIQEGDRVVLWAEVTGTQRGELMGVPPTGLPVRRSETTMLRFEGDRIAEVWHQADELGTLEQLGMTPPEGAGPLGQIAHTFKLMARFAVLQVKAGRAGGAPDTVLPPTVTASGGAAAQHPAQSDGPRPELKAKARELAARTFDEHDLTALDDLARPDARWHLPGRPELGNDGFKELMLHLWQAKPDLRVEILDLVSEGPYIACRVGFTGTHRGELMGIPPTGRRVEMEEVLVQRWDDEGRLVTFHQEADYLGMLGQLGVVPPRGTGPLGQLAHTFTAAARFTWLGLKARRSSGS
ncbi:ester cyclase [Streptomyces sp. NPDC058045]|uniref:ester cyclase n=1 Tax=Streptomyces sp. NPDC058045 TaxID=3346311 RepID=UPI0036E6FCFC